MINFGDWLRITLGVEKISQRKAASMAKIPECSVSTWINGIRSPTFDSVQKLLHGMHYHIEFVKDKADE